MANNLLESANDTFEEAGNEPVLVVTALDPKRRRPYLEISRCQHREKSQKDFPGLGAEKVIVVIIGFNIMELITRARSILYVFLVEMIMIIVI